MFNKINKKILYIGLGSIIVFTLFFSIIFILIHNKSHIKKWSIHQQKQIVAVKIKNSCLINTVYLNPARLDILINSIKNYNIKINKIHNLKNNNVVICTLNKKNKKIINIFNKPWYLLKGYLTYSVVNNTKNNKYSIVNTNVNLEEIKNWLINIVKIDNNVNNYFYYFSDNPNIVLFTRILQQINQNISLGLKLKIKKIKWFNKIKFMDVINKFWANSIVTNTKIIVKLAPDDFNVIKAKLKQFKLTSKLKTIEKIEKISNIYNNTIVFKGKYIIIQNLQTLINSVEKN